MKQSDTLSYLAALATTVFAGIFALEQVYNYDIWWHLNYGNWVITNKEILKSDFLSFSTQGARWINSAWLGSVLFAVIDNIAGLDALILFKALLIGISFGGGCLYLTRKGLNPYIAVFILGYAVVTARFRFLLRPLVFMFPFTVVLLWILFDSATNRKKIFFTSIPLTIIWSNLHGSAYLAPVFSAFLACERFIDWLWCKFKTKEISTLPVPEFMLTVSLGIAVLLTPFGFETLKLVINLFLFEDIIARSTIVQEHLPLQWGSNKMFWGLLFATGASFLINFKKIRVFPLLVFIATGWLSLSSVRYVGITSLIYAILLGQNLQLLALPQLKNIRISSAQHIIFPIILAATAIFAFSNTFGPTKIYQWGLGINASRFPIKAVQFLQQKNYSGNLFNSWKDGGYIQYHLPAVKTFIDGRGLREQAVIAEKVAGMSPYELQQYLDTNQVNAALLANTSTAYLNFFKVSPHFTLVHLDDTHTVYFRGTASKDGRQDVFTFQYIRPQGFDFKYLQPLASGEEVKLVEDEFKRALAQFNDNFSITFQYAIFLDLLNRSEAIDYYLKAAKINPSLGFSHFDLGLKGGKSALRHRRWKEAAAILKMSLEFMKPKPELYFLLGTALYQLKDYENAEIQFKEHLKVDPWSAPTLTNLGFLFIDTGRYPDAKQSFTKALQLKQKQEGAHYGYALTLEKMGVPAAQEAWKLFLERYPNSKWKNEAQKYLVNYKQNSR